MSHLQFFESLYTHLMIFKKRKFQKLINKYEFSVPFRNKISNDIPLTSFDSRMSHQKRA